MLINPQDSILRMQSLRNRRQVPLCRSCHDKVHSGEYDRIALGQLFYKVKNFDNRIASSEGYIIKGEPYEGAPLVLKKGWKKV